MLTDERIQEMFKAWFNPDDGGNYLDCWNACARAIEAEVRAEAQEPGGMLYRFNGNSWHFTPDLRGQFDIEPGPKLDTKEVFFAPRPPAPCPKCAEFPEMHRHYKVELSTAHTRIDALQDKVAEQACDKGLLRIEEPADQPESRGIGTVRSRFAPISRSRPR